ncbi:nucleoporin NDC1 [Brachionus plicatilis]|uniref:Nucleoporin NDC1 n=1 Tax=Brachionus plicatilis TaxID=10195 RepID=A0A3M7S9J5_BRAPC|nr:nucleoporin NDC1 [Brachionus plicatilis]
MVEKRVQNYAGNFHSEVIRWRQLAAKIWSSIIIISLILGHSFTADFDLFDNFTGIFTGFFVSLFSLQFWYRSAIILVAFWITFGFSDKLFKVSHTVYSNNFEKLIQIVYSLEMACIFINFVSAIITSSVLLQFYETKDLHYSFIILFCGFNALIYWLKFVFNGNYLLNWPIIEQTKYSRLKSRVYKTILSVLKSNLINLIIWSILYAIMEYGVNNSILSEEEIIQFDFFSTTIVAVKLSFMINFAFEISWNIYEIYMTEMYHFNIHPVDASDLPLATAMSLNSQPYIQILSLTDFCDLSINSKSRRSQLFSLNLNNQPVNWIKVSTEALNVIKDFMEVFSFDDMLHGSSAHSDPYDSNLYKRFSVVSPKRDINSPNISPYKSPIRKAHMNETYDVPVHSPIKYRKSLANENNSLGFKMAKSLIEKLKKQKYFAMIYKENKNYKTQQLFVDSFMVIASLKGLSNLVMASLKEDEYGIVQQNLAEIITTFIDLQKVIEKFNQTGSGCSISFRILQNSHPDQIELFIQKLIFILNESIYKITHTFGTSLKSLALNDEVNSRLQRYRLHH